MFRGLFQPMHLLVILAIVLIIFGPGKLPDMGSAIGKAIRCFKSSVKDPEQTPEEEAKKLENKA
jgi:sec-independent protein translocase protein TatA